MFKTTSWHELTTDQALLECYNHQYKMIHYNICGLCDVIEVI